jgi:hypothetical protein
LKGSEKCGSTLNGLEIIVSLGIGNAVKDLAQSNVMRGDILRNGEPDEPKGSS